MPKESREVGKPISIPSVRDIEHFKDSILSMYPWQQNFAIIWQIQWYPSLSNTENFNISHYLLFTGCQTLKICKMSVRDKLTRLRYMYAKIILDYTLL